MIDAPPPRPAELCVLIVEDESKLRSLLHDVVGDLGFQVRAASSAEAAMKLMESTPIQILLTDMHLPGKSGLDLLQTLRNKNWAGSAIVISAFGSFPAAQRAIKLDVCDFIAKPFDLSQIEQSLERARSRVARMSMDSNKTKPAAKPARLDEIELGHILDALEQFHGNRTKAANAIGISRRTLYNKLKNRQLPL